jgi:hypothetical protein
MGRTERTAYVMIRIIGVADAKAALGGMDDRTGTRVP